MLPDKMVERSGFEPLKAIASRFTVCPVWPLRYLSAQAENGWPASRNPESFRGDGKRNHYARDFMPSSAGFCTRQTRKTTLSFPATATNCYIETAMASAKKSDREN